MNGLLGIDDPRTMGLLSLGMRLMSTPGKLGQALGTAGMGALGDVSQVVAQNRQNERQKRLDEERSALSAAQLAELQAQTAARQAAVDKAKQEAEKAARIQQILTGAVSPVSPIEANAVSGVTGPRPEALSVVGQRKPVDWAQLIAMGVPPELAKAIAEAPNLGRPEVARTVEVDDGKGGKATRQVDRFGNAVGGDLPGYVAPQLVDLGGQKTFAKPRAGTVFDMTLAPGEAERINISRVAANAASRQAGAAEEANRISREQEQRLRQLKIDEGEAKARERDQQRATGIATITDSLAVMDKAINHPGRQTAYGVSGQVDPRNYLAGTDAMNFRIVLDQIQGKAFLQAFESLKGGGQITETEGKKATDAIARLNRAQSDAEGLQALQDFRDVLSSAYKRATGQEYRPQTPRVDTSVGVPQGWGIRKLGGE